MLRQRVDETQLVFATPAVSDVIRVTDVHVTFDDHVTRRGAVQFQYVDNPVITDIRPLSGFVKYAFVSPLILH